MPVRSISIFGQFDLILTCVPELKERFTTLGLNSRHIHHGFDVRVLEHIEQDREQDIPFSFIGQLIRARDFHGERIRQLERIAEAMEIAIFSPSYELYRGSRWSLTRGLGHHVARLLARLQPMSRQVKPSAPNASEKLRPYTRPAVFGLAMYQTLQRTQVCFNSHIDISSGSASNRRLFESTGVGSCLLTDHKANLSTLFELDREVVTFSSTEECIHKAKWLLDHPQERQRIARAGQRRTLSDHTVVQRAVQFDSLIREALR